MHEILTVREAAQYLKLGKPTLDRYRVTGDGPRYVRMSPGAIRYRRADLECWLESKLTSSTSEAA
ncbi:MAG: helix-turn-helix domain-containing protein [Novosphingobium sp.]